MRFLLLTTVALLFGTALSSQTLIGLRGGYGASFIDNKYISDAGDNLDYKGTYAGSFGIHAIQLVGEKSGIGLQIGTSALRQETQGDTQDILGNDIRYVSEFKSSYTDIGLLYTYMVEDGFYLEIGPQISLRKDEETNIRTNGEQEQQLTITSDPFLSRSTVFGVFGIGGTASLSDEIKMKVGLQFGYGITDLTEDIIERDLSVSEENNISQFTYYANGADDEQEDRRYQTTHPIYGRFLLGIYYQFGD